MKRSLLNVNALLERVVVFHDLLMKEGFCPATITEAEHLAWLAAHILESRRLKGSYRDTYNRRAELS